MDNLWAWIIVALAAPLTLFALHRGFHGAPLPRMRGALGWLLGAWMVVPAPVPGHPDHYAPAFLVFAFEWLFQNPGSPRASGIILLAAGALALALALVWNVLRRRNEG